MCGIGGIFSNGRSESRLKQISADMANTLHHRGPDAKGVWCDGSHIAMGHARLAVIDLSPNGLQPMTSLSQKYTICFNGEIYNFLELKDHLVKKEVSLRGESDTEALVECIDEFGLDWTLENSRGMFAFALWNAESKELTLCRDRLGEKPLYYGRVGNDLVFASELKAFRSHPEFTLNIDRTALCAYVKYGYVPTPQCILDGFKKLPASTYISGASVGELYSSKPISYWEPAIDHVNSNVDLEQLLIEVVGNQMVSDVPIGSFLSGGIDSSLVSAIMQSQCEQPINTYTIGFNEGDYDESKHAKAVADHIGSRHTEWIIGPNHILDLIPKMANIYDEPFADSSQLPTTLLAQMTRKEVTVCLSGDGGDESFCGYERYRRADYINRAANHTPEAAKSLLSKFVHSKSIEHWDKLIGYLPIKITQPGRKAYTLCEMLEANPEQIYDRLLSQWHNPEEVVIDGHPVSTVTGFFREGVGMKQNAMNHDTKFYLTDDIMVKVDRATMSASLESRAPLLDHRIVEYANGLSVKEKCKNGKTKAPLRQVLYKYVPKSIIERPKMGFGVPLEHWLRKELKGWAEERIDPTQLSDQGFFNLETIEKYWGQHQSCGYNRQFHLWNILMFQEWLAAWDG